MTNELIAALEAAEGASRELDAAIADLRWMQNWGKKRPKDIHAAPVTSSIDAAMTLVPEGWRPSIDCTFDRPEVTMHPWSDHLFKHGRKYGKAATPAIAICIAALRAGEA